MRYIITYKGKEHIVAIDNKWLFQQMKNLNISKREAIDLWMFDNGYLDNEVVRELTAKAKENKVERDITPKNGKRAAKRPPDLTKSKIINQLHDFLMKSDETYGCGQHLMYAIEIVNPERVISFHVGDEVYELTLSKRRNK